VLLHNKMIEPYQEKWQTRMESQVYLTHDGGMRKTFGFVGKWSVFKSCRRWTRAFLYI